MILSLFIHFVHKTTIWYNIKIKDTLLYYILLLYIYIYHTVVLRRSGIPLISLEGLISLIGICTYIGKRNKKTYVHITKYIAILMPDIIKDIFFFLSLYKIEI